MTTILLLSMAVITTINLNINVIYNPCTSDKLGLCCGFVLQSEKPILSRGPSQAVPGINEEVFSQS